MLVRDESAARSPGRQFAGMRAAQAISEIPDRRQRRAHVYTIERIVQTHAAEIAAAISADFRHRSGHETQLIEIIPTVRAARYARAHLARWMAPQRAATAPYFWPARARVIFQPLGVVGIIAPWNYPLLLAFGPLIAALAAGNRALIKLSEHTPQTGELLGRLIGDAFAADHVALTTGGIDVGKSFAALPFDHLLFTGSTQTGRSVMRAAAGNLTPVTLELGGKSPAIIGPDATPASAAARIMSGKLRNAGQTCIAPDYVLLPEALVEQFVSEARRVVLRRYPSLPENQDYTRIINTHQVDRLVDLIADARAHGATIVTLHPHCGDADRRTGLVPPLILTGVDDAMRIMHEEIFGPLLPLVTYRTLDDAIAYVNARPSPLALYYFGANVSDAERVVARTRSGGVCINDVVLQFAQDALPFGGVGASGMGAYHGRAGFETFSHARAVFAQAKRSSFGFLEPPYGRRFEAIVRLLLR